MTWLGLTMIYWWRYYDLMTTGWWRNHDMMTLIVMMRYNWHIIDNMSNRILWSSNDRLLTSNMYQCPFKCALMIHSSCILNVSVMYICDVISSELLISISDVTGNISDVTHEIFLTSLMQYFRRHSWNISDVTRIIDTSFSWRIKTQKCTEVLERWWRHRCVIDREPDEKRKRKLGQPCCLWVYKWTRVMLRHYPTLPSCPWTTNKCEMTGQQNTKLMRKTEKY